MAASPAKRVVVWVAPMGVVVVVVAREGKRRWRVGEGEVACAEGWVVVDGSCAAGW